MVVWLLLLLLVLLGWLLLLRQRRVMLILLGVVTLLRRLYWVLEVLRGILLLWLHLLLLRHVLLLLLRRRRWWRVVPMLRRRLRVVPEWRGNSFWAPLRMVLLLRLRRSLLRLLLSVYVFIVGLDWLLLLQVGRNLVERLSTIVASLRVERPPSSGMLRLLLLLVLPIPNHIWVMLLMWLLLLLVLLEVLNPGGLLKLVLLLRNHHHGSTARVAGARPATCGAWVQLLLHLLLLVLEDLLLVVAGVGRRPSVDLWPGPVGRPLPAPRAPSVVHSLGLGGSVRVERLSEAENIS